jgi:hypothetical protein
VITKFVFFGLGLATLAIGAEDSSLIIAIIGGIVATTSSVTLVTTVLSNNRIRRMEISQAVNHAKLAELEKNTNSIKDALIASTKLASFSEGEASERAKQGVAQANVEKGKAEGSKGV